MSGQPVELDADALVDPMTYPLLPEQQQAIRQAFTRMPYAAHIGGELTIETVEHLVVVLGRLAERLRGVAARGEANDQALLELQQQQHAVRAFLGLL